MQTASSTSRLVVALLASVLTLVSLGAPTISAPSTKHQAPSTSPTAPSTKHQAPSTSTAPTLPPALARLAPLKGYSAGHVLALQICLARRGFSCNTLDGSCGRKTQVAFATWCAVNGKVYTPGQEEKGWETYFRGETNLVSTQTITAADVAALVAIPTDPAAKSKLAAMGYRTLQEMFAERGHTSENLLVRLNPTLRWPNPPVGSVVVLPNATRQGPVQDRKHPDGVADVLRVSLSRREVTAFDAQGRLIALFPCSIAADKNKLPPPGEIEVTTLIANPNYTHTEERGRGRVSRYIYPPGPNNPVGIAWVGLSLPSYGMHGTPFPEQIGRAESHGCFRLANWNAERLRRMCTIGTRIVVER